MYYYILPTDKDIVHKSHKYVEKKMGRNGKWIYYYSKKPTLRGKYGTYAKEKLERQKNTNTVKLTNIANDSRENAERRETQRKANANALEKVQSEYDATLKGKLEKISNAGKAFLEKMGVFFGDKKADTNYKSSRTDADRVVAPKLSDLPSERVISNKRSSTGLTSSRVSVKSISVDPSKLNDKTYLDNTYKNLLMPYNEIPIVTTDKKKKRLREL